MRSLFPALFLWLLLASAEAERFTSPLGNPNFERKGIPNEWLPAQIPPKGQEMKLFLDLDEAKEFRTAGQLISHLIELCGMPLAYLISKDKKKDISNYLVYDLSSAGTIILYVGTPPTKYFAAAAAFDSKGKLLRLIK